MGVSDCAENKRTVKSFNVLINSKIVYYLHSFNSHSLFEFDLITCYQDRHRVLYLACNLPPCRSTCPTTLLFSMLCLFPEFLVSALHPVHHELLSRPSIFPSIISLCRL